MTKEEDFTVEDDKETQEFFGKAASSEYQRTIARLKYENRRAQLLFLRKMGRDERREFKKKFKPI